MTFREAREALGLSQGELARALGIGRRTVIRLEQAATVPLVYELALEALAERRRRQFPAAA